MQNKMVDWFKRKPMFTLAAVAFGVLLASAVAFLSGIAFERWQIVALYVVATAVSILAAAKICSKRSGTETANAPTPDPGVEGGTAP